MPVDKKNLGHGHIYLLTNVFSVRKAMKKQRAHHLPSAEQAMSAHL
jgi:hypothetical protein